MGRFGTWDSFRSIAQFPKFAKAVMMRNQQFATGVIQLGELIAVFTKKAR